MIIKEEQMKDVEKRLHEGYVLKERAKMVQLKYIKKYSDAMKSKIKKGVYSEIINDLTYILSITESEDLQDERNK